MRKNKEKIAIYQLLNGAIQLKTDTQKNTI